MERSRTGVARYAAASLPVLLVVVLVAATSPASVAAVRSANEKGEVPQDEASCLDPVFDWIQGEVAEPSTVLAPYEENSCLPARDADANVAALRGISGDTRTENDLFNFYSSFTLGARGEELLRREEVDYVLVPSDSPLNAQLRHLPGFAALNNPGERYELYGVDPGALTETTAMTANTLAQNEDFDAATGYYTAALDGDANEQFLAYMGLGLLNSRQGLYADAAANYEQALEIDPGEPTLYPLLSNAYNMSGEPDLARLALENGVDRFPDEVWLRTALGTLLMYRDPEAAAGVQREVVEMFPEVPEYRVSLGTYLGLDGDDEAAERQFEYAIRKNPFSAELHADVGLANQITGRREEAIRHYERALELNPGLPGAQEQLQKLRQQG